MFSGRIFWMFCASGWGHQLWCPSRHTGLLASLSIFFFFFLSPELSLLIYWIGKPSERANKNYWYVCAILFTPSRHRCSQHIQVHLRASLSQTHWSWNWMSEKEMTHLTRWSFCLHVKPTQIFSDYWSWAAFSAKCFSSLPKSTLLLVVWKRFVSQQLLNSLS